MKTVVTDAGINACLQAGMTGPKIDITQVKIGSQIIEVTPDMTDVYGEVWSGGLDYINYQVQDSDVFAFKITLDEAIGDFDCGNIGLFTADGTLFSITTMDKPERKIKNAEDVVGNRKIFVIPIKLSGISQLINVSLLVPDEASIPFVQTQLDLPQVNLAAYSVYEIINHTEFNASALALRTPTKWIYIASGGSGGYSFPATMFDDDTDYGSLVYYDSSTVTFKLADGLDDTKGYLGIRSEYNTIISSGTYFNQDYHLTPGRYYYANGNANAGKLTTTPNKCPVGYAPTSNTIIVGAMPETTYNKTQSINTSSPTDYKYPSETAVVDYGNTKADIDLYNTMFISDCCINAPSGVASASGLTVTLPANYSVLFSNGRDSTNKMVSLKRSTTSALTATVANGDYSIILVLSGSTFSLRAVLTNIIKYETGTYSGTYYRKDFAQNKWYYRNGSSAETQITMFIVWQGIASGGNVTQSNPVYPINLMTGMSVGGSGGDTTLVNVANEPDFRRMVIDWVVPNYSSAVSISSGWTANKTGWIVAVHAYDVALASVYIDGVKVSEEAADGFGGAGIFPIKKGSTITTSGSFSSLKFYPCYGW